MSAITTIQGIIKSSVTGPAWHGPAVMELLADVSAEQAAAKPIANAHSIWELVLHMDAWQAFALRICEGDPEEMLQGDADWPPVTDTSAEAWEAAKQSFVDTANRIRACIADWDDAKLREPLPGREFPFKVLLHGVAHHNLYHAGQIGLLKKA